MKDIEYFGQWQEHDGKRVYLNGRAVTLRVNTVSAIYPYPHQRFDAS